MWPWEAGQEVTATTHDMIEMHLPDLHDIFTATHERFVRINNYAAHC